MPIDPSTKEKGSSIGFTVPSGITGKKRAPGGRSAPRVRAHTDGAFYSSSSTVLPPQFRARLQEWFVLIEQEFEALYAQNLSLQEKVTILNERLERSEGADRCDSKGLSSNPPINVSDLSTPLSNTSTPIESLYASSNTLTTHSSSLVPAVASKSVSLPFQPLPFKSNKGSSINKTKAATKLRVQTSRIVSSFKTSPVQCRFTRQYVAHRDGVWDVDTTYRDALLLGTASADQRACIWGVECGKIVLQYTGHSGSVNSIRFHPTRELVLTASGDHTAHIWQAAVSHENLKVQSSEDEVEGSGGEDDEGGGEERGGDGSAIKAASLRTPLVEFRGHNSVVSAADWLPGGDQIITSSWDRLACLYDAQTSQLTAQLTGHDRELTHCCSHPTQRLVATASQDSTFRLYDFRDHRHTVAVFQGHTDSVTSVCFTAQDKVVSGSDDRSVKVWDIKNMRTAFATIRLDSAVNRLAVSPVGGMIAIPHDNRQIRLYDLTGQRLARLPHSNRMGHRRSVCSVAWGDNSANIGGAGSPNFKDAVGSQQLFSAGFDRRIYGWEINVVKEKE